MDLLALDPCLIYDTCFVRRRNGGRQRNQPMDLQDSNWGDFSYRRAVDSSSFDIMLQDRPEGWSQTEKLYDHCCFHLITLDRNKIIIKNVVTSLTPSRCVIVTEQELSPYNLRGMQKEGRLAKRRWFASPTPHPTLLPFAYVYSTVYSDADQRKRQSSAWLAFVRGIHPGPANAPHKCLVTRKMFPFDDVIMKSNYCYVMCVHRQCHEELIIFLYNFYYFVNSPLDNSFWIQVSPWASSATLFILFKHSRSSFVQSNSGK